MTYAERIKNLAYKVELDARLSLPMTAACLGRYLALCSLIGRTYPGHQDDVVRNFGPDMTKDAIQIAIGIVNEFLPSPTQAN